VHERAVIVGPKLEEFASSRKQNPPHEGLPGQRGRYERSGMKIGRV
jgi:hypothetical protein